MANTISERDQILINYAKISGAFYFAANKYMACRTDKNLLEAQNWINRVLNNALPVVEDYCKKHSDEENVDSLLSIAKADSECMRRLFENLK